MFLVGDSERNVGSFWKSNRLYFLVVASELFSVAFLVRSSSDRVGARISRFENKSVRAEL